MLCVLVKMYLFPPLLLTSLNQFYVKIMNMTKLIDVDFHKFGGCTSSWQYMYFSNATKVHVDSQ